MLRPALEDAQPVDNTGYTNEAYLRGTWIAECVIHKGTSYDGYDLFMFMCMCKVDMSGT